MIALLDEEEEEELEVTVAADEVVTLADAEDVAADVEYEVEVWFVLVAEVLPTVVVLVLEAIGDWLVLIAEVLPTLVIVPGAIRDDDVDVTCFDENEA